MMAEISIPTKTPLKERGFGIKFDKSNKTDRSNTTDKSKRANQISIMTESTLIIIKLNFDNDG